MASVAAIAILAILLGGFLLLTAFESGRGARMFPALRSRLDARVGRAMDLFHAEDPGGKVIEKLRAALSFAAHEFAHVALVVVRALERSLTRAVRALRARLDGTTPSGGE